MVAAIADDISTLPVVATITDDISTLPVVATIADDISTLPANIVGHSVMSSCFS